MASVETGTWGKTILFSSMVRHINFVDWMNSDKKIKNNALFHYKSILFSLCGGNLHFVYEGGFLDHKNAFFPTKLVWIVHDSQDLNLIQFDSLYGIIGLTSQSHSILIQFICFDTDLITVLFNFDYICFKSDLFWCQELLLGINTDYENHCVWNSWSSQDLIWFTRLIQLKLE